MSETAIPFVKDLAAVKDVAWKPYCGLVVSFRSSALQLMTRVLELPRKLPACQRPKAAPAPGSKSSKSKAELVQARSLARMQREDTSAGHVGVCEGLVRSSRRLRGLLVVSVTRRLRRPPSPFPAPSSSSLSATDKSNNVVSESKESPFALIPPPPGGVRRIPGGRPGRGGPEGVATQTRLPPGGPRA